MSYGLPYSQIAPNSPREIVFEYDGRAVHIFIGELK